MDPIIQRKLLLTSLWFLPGFPSAQINILVIPYILNLILVHEHLPISFVVYKKRQFYREMFLLIIGIIL